MDSALDVEPSSTASEEPQETGDHTARARHRLLTVLLGLVGFVILVLAWQVTSSLELLRGLIPSPLTVGNVLIAGLVSGALLTDLLVSSARVLVGVSIGVALAIPVGFLLGWFPTARSMFNPMVNFFRALPPIALVPLVVIYFGIGEVARVLVLIYTAFFASVIIIYEGISAIEEKYVRAALTLGATRSELLRKVVFPLSVPHIFTAARVSLGIGWSTLVAAELIAAQQGLGAAISNASNYMDIPTVYAGIILIGIAALIMDVVIRAVGVRVLRWQDRGDR